MTSFGESIRTFREKKGLTLNQFASQLGVSSGYLSNLETGKTQTVRLDILEKLNQELFVSPIQQKDDKNPLSYRLERASRLLQECHQKNPHYTNHFLSQFEQSLDLLREG